MDNTAHQTALLSWPTTRSRLSCGPPSRTAKSSTLSMVRRRAADSSTGVAHSLLPTPPWFGREFTFHRILLHLSRLNQSSLTFRTLLLPQFWAEARFPIIHRLLRILSTHP